MKHRLIKLFFLATLSLQVLNVAAQEPYENGFLKNYGVGLKFGLYGIGVDFHTAIAPQWKVRLGFNYFKYNLVGANGKYTASVDNLSTVTGAKPTLDLSFDGMNVKFPNADILVDYYPVKKGIFSITGGFYIGSNRITANGAVADFQPGDAFGVPDYVIVHPDSKGLFGGTLHMGATIKPYLGVGVGRIIPKSKVSFRADLGIIYQGRYSISGDGSIIVPVAKDVEAAKRLAQLGASNAKALISNQLSSYLKWWPMLSFTIYYRIK